MRPLALVLLTALITLVTVLGSAHAARYPDPGGNELAPLSLPPADGRFFGANDDFEKRRGQRLLGALADGGANIARRTLSWWHMEPIPDVASEVSWAAAQRFHDGAVARGITPIHVLGFAPPWARKRGTRGCIVVGACEFPPRRREIDQWTEFAAEAARRFDGAVFEIWNEPNLRDFWQPAPDPELWAELVVSAYDAIKAVDPDATVIACGCAAVLSDERPAAAMPVREFLSRAYDHTVSIHGRFDGISVHLFPQTATLDEQHRRVLRFGRSSMLAGLLDAVRASGAEHGEAPKPVWITEAGYWTRSSGYPGTELTKAEVAEALSRLARRVFSAPGIRALLIHRAQDSGRSDGLEFGTREASFGLFAKGKNLDPKPSFCVFAGFAARHDYPGCAQKTGPAARLAVAPHGATAPGVAPIVIEAPAEAALLECKVNGRPYTDCPSRFEVDAGEPGRYVVRARARDAAGHAGVAARARWHVKK